MPSSFSAQVDLVPSLIWIVIFDTNAFRVFPYKYFCLRHNLSVFSLDLIFLSDTKPFRIFPWIDIYTRDIVPMNFIFANLIFANSFLRYLYLNWYQIWYGKMNKIIWDIFEVFYTLHIDENYQKSRKFWSLALSINFCPIKIDLSGSTVWPQISGFQNSSNWHF